MELTRAAVVSSLTLALLAMAGSSSSAQTVFNWNAPGPGNGNFGNPFIWSPAGPPGTTGEARFNSANSDYTVTFTTDPTNARMRIGNDHVTFNLGGHTYALTTTSTSDPSIMVGGITFADDALLTLTGGRLAGQHAVIAAAILQTSAGMVVGSGATLDLAGTFTIGKQNPGSLVVQSGGDVLSATGVLGASGAGVGNVTVTGSGSTWSNSGNIDVGVGTLSIASQGLVDVGGTLKVLPGGAVALDGGTLETATLQLAGGALNWTSGTLRFSSNLGVEPSGPLGASVAVGAGKLLDTDGHLNVGNAGSSTLNVTGGGQVHSNTGSIGTQIGSTGVVTIEGNISNWNTRGDLHIGNAGDGTLNVSNGGRVLVHDADAFIGDGGSVVLDDGSWRIQGEQCTFCAAGGTLTIFGGDLEIKGGGLVHNESESFIRQGGTVKVSGVGSTWEFDDRLAISSSQVLISNGGVVLGGTGDSDVSIGGEGFVTVDGIGSKMDLASSSHLNDLLVGVLSSSGSLAVTNGGLVEAGNVIVSPMSEIQGNGSIMGHVQNGGLVSPGTSPGALSIEGDYTQTADGELLIELGPLSYDQLLINDQTTLGGTLIVNLLDNFIPSAGQTFTIITADDVDGTFATEMLPSVPGLIFDVIYNPQSVVLTVSPAFTADFDSDGHVDSGDLNQWQGDFAANALSDADDDGDSDGADFLAWQQQLGSGAPSTPTAAPEPGAAFLAAFALAAYVAIQRWPAPHETTDAGEVR
jgi:T5SS/PEP-CTERM-associated repeat protein